MQEPIRLKKVWAMKTHEKESTSLLYEESIRTFEEHAKNLYNLLRQKEQLKFFEITELQTGLPVLELQNNEIYIQRLDMEIQRLQLAVMKSRENMLIKKAELLEKSKEEKKYEKIVEKKQAVYDSWLAKREDEFINEISTLRYIEKEVR